MGLEEMSVIILTNVLECYIWNLFMRSFFNYRVNSTAQRIGMRAVILIFMSLVNCVGNVPVNLTGTVFIYMISALYLFEGNRRQLLYFNIIEILIVIFCEDIVIGAGYGGRYIIPDMNAGKFVVILAAKLFAILLVYAVIRLMQGRRQNKEGSVPLPFLLCPALSLLLIRIVYQVTLYADVAVTAVERLMLTVICALLAVFNIVILEIYNRNVQMQTQITEQKLLQQKNRMETENYAQLERVTQNYRQVLHDINRYLNTLSYLAGENQDDKIQEIVRDIHADISRAEETHYSANGILNFILNEKKRRADSKGISMDIFVEPGFRAGNIKDYDFISIMSNLLDNSLEAAELCPEGERSIELKMFMDTDRSYAVIRLENSCLNKAVSGQGLFLTAKADRTRHGIGLKLMQGRRQNKEASVPLPFLLCPALSLLLIRIVYQVTLYADVAVTAVERLMLTVICALLAVFNIVILEIYNRNVQMQTQITEQKLLQQKNRMETENYAQLERVTQNYRQVLHDINRYLNTLSYLAGENQDDKIQEIVRDIHADISRAEETHYSANGILNFILNEKKRRADSKGISMDIFVEPGFRAGNIKDYDFISIMSNLLDNSLEAAELCPEGERSIELKMFMDTDRSYAVIRLENSCLNKAVSGQGLFLTAKADRTRHGIGLKHVKKLIESNHGLIDFDVHTNTFCVTVCLSVPPRQAG